MTENVTVFGDFADDFDALVVHDEKLLDSYVEGQGYSLGSMVLASTMTAFMRFAQVMVDTGRLGNGLLVEGGWRGAGKDALRALNVVGVAGAAAGRALPLLRVTQATNASTCAWVAQLNADKLAGHQLGMTLERMVQGAGGNMAEVAAVGRGADDYTLMANFLRGLNVPVQEIRSAEGSLENAVSVIRSNPNGVVTFSVRFVEAGRNVGHRLYATFSRTAGLVVRDPHGQTYRSLAALYSKFGQSATLSGSPMLFIRNAVIVQAAAIADQTAGIASMLREIAVHVVPKVEVRAADAETAAQVITIRDTFMPVRRSIHTVVPGEFLSTLALRYYRQGQKWPLIYEANRRVIGPNSNGIRPGQQLVIPEPPVVRLRRH